jgi:hypothetical protein
VSRFHTRSFIIGRWVFTPSATIRLRSCAWPVLGTLAVLALLAAVGTLDDADRRNHQAQMDQRWEQGRQLGHQEAARLQLADKRTAYMAGLEEGQERCALLRP